MNLSKEEIFAYNAGLKQASYQLTKAMMALEIDEIFAINDIKRLLKFIHDEIEKEKK